jgi:hypothetical protein
VHLLIERIEDFSSNLRLDLLQDPLIFERDLQRRLQVLERRHVPTSASGLMSAKTSEQGKRLLILPTAQPPVESRNLLSGKRLLLATDTLNRFLLAWVPGVVL